MHALRSRIEIITCSHVSTFHFGHEINDQIMVTIWYKNHNINVNDIKVLTQIILAISTVILCIGKHEGHVLMV